MRALLILNAHSRNGEATEDSVCRHLQTHGITIVERAPQNDLTEIINRSKADVDLVVAGGGDGTLRSVAAGLVESKLPLAIVPLGTANDLARSLNIPPNVEEACAIIAAGKLHEIDVGVVNGRYFFNVAHIGLGTHVNRELTSQSKSFWGVMSYPWALVRAFRRNRPFHAQVSCAGRTNKLHTIELAVGNGRHYGGGMTIAAPATLDDHLLHVYSIAPLGFARLLTLAPALRRGLDRQRPGIQLFCGQQVEIDTTRPMKITADGETITHTPARFQVLSAAVKVFVPPGGATPIPDRDTRPKPQHESPTTRPQFPQRAVS